MATVEIGIRIDRERGISFFGVEEVNRRIAGGARVVEVRPGGAIMIKSGEENDAGTDVRMTLGGCQIQIVLEDA